MHCRYCLDDGQAETVTLATVRPRRVNAVEAIEQSPEVLGWNCRARVGYCYARMVFRSG